MPGPPAQPSDSFSPRLRNRRCECKCAPACVRCVPLQAPVVPADSLPPAHARANLRPPPYGYSSEPRLGDSAPGESPTPTWPRFRPCRPPAFRPDAKVPTDASSSPTRQRVWPHPGRREIASSPRASRRDNFPRPHASPTWDRRETTPPPPPATTHCAQDSPPPPTHEFPSLDARRPSELVQPNRG